MSEHPNEAKCAKITAKVWKIPNASIWFLGRMTHFLDSDSTEPNLPIAISFKNNKTNLFSEENKQTN